MPHFQLWIIKTLKFANNIIVKGGATGFKATISTTAPASTVNVKIENNQQYLVGSPNLKCSCYDGANNIVCPSGNNVCANIVIPGQFKASPYTDNPQFIATSDVTIVNNDSSGTSSTGTWNVGRTSDIREYSDDSRYHAAGSGDYYQFRTTGVNKTAPTLVAIWWPRTNSKTINRSGRVPVEVFDGDASTTPLETYYIDQKSWDSSSWYYLGRLTFTTGISRVRVRSVNDGEVTADAVLWSRLGQGFKLSATSPDINRGVSTAATITHENSPTTTATIVTKDYFGIPVPRVAGTLPDVGIHEAQ